LFYVEQLMNTPSFCMWNSQTEWKRKKNHKKKSSYPILVLKYKTKTKHTHLKRCLYYNHLPQPLKNLQPTEITTKEALLKLWLSQIIPGTRSQCWWLWQVLPTPLGTEDTNEEILSITQGIEGTRLNNTGHASSSKNWLAEAHLSNCPLIRLVRKPKKVSELIVSTKAENTGQKAGQLWTFWWKNQSNRHTIW